MGMTEGRYGNDKKKGGDDRVDAKMI